jgi:predicted RNA-binding protein YlxR (DUF448 family)
MAAPTAASQSLPARGGGKWVLKDRHHAGEEAAQRAFARAMSELMAA